MQRFLKNLFLAILFFIGSLYSMDFSSDSEANEFSSEMDFSLYSENEENMEFSISESEGENSSEENDTIYVYEGPTFSAVKRREILSSFISPKTLYAWPSLWKIHGFDKEFISNLALFNREKDGNTLLHLAMRESISYTFTLEKKVKIIGDLLIAGADLCAKNSDRDTPLHYLAMSSRLSKKEAAEILIIINKYKNSILWEDLQNNYGSTPLHIVCDNGLVDKWKFSIFILLDAKKIFLTQNNFGQNFLHRLVLACQTPDKEEIIKDLFHEKNKVIFGGYLEILEETEDNVGKKPRDYLR